jgi:ABC-type branched-subunit amino acid transport system permease subunit
MLGFNPESTRHVDVVWAPLAIGVAGTLLVLAFQKKLEELRNRNPLFLVIPAILLVGLGLALIRSKLIYIAIPLPVLRLTGTKDATIRFVQSSIIASFVLITAIFGPPTGIPLRDPKKARIGWNGDPLFGRYFVGLLLVQDFLVNQVRNLDSLPGPHQTQLMWGILAAAMLCSFCHGNLAAFEEWKTKVIVEHQVLGAPPTPAARRRAYAVYYGSHVLRVLSLAFIWTAVILQLWTRNRL